MAPEPAAHQGEVAHDVPDLVAQELVGVAQVIVHDTVAVQHDGVDERGAPGQSLGSQLVRVPVETEGAGASQIVLELLVIDDEPPGLPADRGMVELDGRGYAEVDVGQGHVRGSLLALDRDRVDDFHDLGLGVLHLRPRFPDRFHPGGETAVEDGDLRSVQLEHGVVHLQCRQRRQHMFHREDLDAGGAHAGAEFRGGDVLQVRGNRRCAGEVGAGEGDSRVRGGGPDRERGRLPRVDADPLERDLVGDGVLAAAGRHPASSRPRRRSTRPTRRISSGSFMRPAMDRR